MEDKRSLVAPAALWWMPLARGILLVVFGLLMFAWGRGATLMGVIQFLGAYWLAGGIFDLVEGVIGRPEGSRIWMIVSAIVSMAAGVFSIGESHYQRFDSRYVSDHHHGFGSRCCWHSSCLVWTCWEAVLGRNRPGYLLCHFRHGCDFQSAFYASGHTSSASLLGTHNRSVSYCGCL